MDIKDIICKKENKSELTFEEIEFSIKNFLSQKINKNEMTDFLKVIYKNGMSEKETFYLTSVMTNSGKILNFHEKDEIYADKHSTGGISDSTTLIIAPIIACADIKFLKMSGRKLGFTGGTVDKLECFKGYKVDISIEQAKELVAKNGAVLMSQTEDLAPADKYLYKLRDETNTIMSIPLIASSIMSKKLTSDSDVIVLDIKCGNGAFMKSKKMALALSRTMLKIGQNAGKKISTVITDMNQPLGSYVGSLLEVVEAINVLKGEKNRLSELSVFLSAKIIELSKNISFEKAKKEVTDILNSGKAFEKLKTMVKDQGGTLDLFNEKYVKSILTNSIKIKSIKSGFISKFDLEKLGNYARQYCNEGNSGIKILVNLGDYVQKNCPIIELYGKNTELNFAECIHYSKNNKINTKLIIDVL